MVILEIVHSLQNLLSYGCNWKFSVKTAVIRVEILIQYYKTNILTHNSNADCYKLLTNQRQLFFMF